MQTLRIATRKSPLAMWQAEHVQQRLREAQPDLQVELVAMSTRGDQLLGSPLAKIGGKGLFIKELEVAMLDGRADIAVHSIKDMPAVLPEGFELGPILARESPLDALVSNQYASVDELPDGATVGSCSLRRRAQLLSHNPTLKIQDLRGNVNTRLAKLDSGRYDAIILAVAGLERLGMHDRIRQKLSPTASLPAVGQGAIAIETRAGDKDTQAVLQVLDDQDTRDCIIAERALNGILNGGCQAPVAGFATLQGDVLQMTALVATPDGKTVLRESAEAPRSDAVLLGQRIGQALLDKGADKILADLAIA